MDRPDNIIPLTQPPPPRRQRLLATVIQYVVYFYATIDSHILDYLNKLNDKHDPATVVNINVHSATANDLDFSVGDILHDLHDAAAARADDFDKSFNDVTATTRLDYFDQHYVDYHAALHDEYTATLGVHHHHGPTPNDIIVHHHHNAGDHNHVIWFNNDHDTACALNYTAADHTH